MRLVPPRRRVQAGRHPRPRLAPPLLSAYPLALFLAARFNEATSQSRDKHEDERTMVSIRTVGSVGRHGSTLVTCCHIFLLIALNWCPSVAGATRELQIHLMPHTHCDVGYKKTFEGYFLTEVRPILHSVTKALMSDKERRFIWSEVAYLKRWLEGPITVNDPSHPFRIHFVLY